MNLEINKEYKKTDIYKIFNVPKGRQGGAWNKGHINFKVKGFPTNILFLLILEKGKVMMVKNLIMIIP